MTTKCDRCRKERHYLEMCNTCNRNACKACQKASKTASKTDRRIICKDCWTKIPLRKQWEQA